MNSHFQKLQTQIKGPVFSILTPFNPSNDEIDFEALENYIQKVFDAGGRVFYVMAYNSRYSQLTFEEIKALNLFVKKKSQRIKS